MTWLSAIGAAIFIAGMYCVICGLLLLSWAALHLLGKLLDTKENPHD